MREGVFVPLNGQTLPTKSIACLRLEIRLQIKKLWSKWWFYTISEQSFCNSVTSKLWKNILEKWVLGGLQKVSGWFYIDVWELKPYFVKHLELTCSQTAKIPFEILPIVTVWHLGSLLEFFPFSDKMLIFGAYRLYLYAAKSYIRIKILAAYVINDPIIHISQLKKRGQLKCHTVTKLVFLPKVAPIWLKFIQIHHHIQCTTEIYMADG